MIDPFQSAATWLAKLESGELSARQATEIMIERIEQIDPKINAVVVRDFSGARLAADAADDARKRGETLGLLHGLPMTVKEAFDVSGLTTTWGVPKFKNNVAYRDSLVVEKLRSAGAIILGKTNVPLMLSDWQTFNEIYGGDINNMIDFQHMQNPLTLVSNHTHSVVNLLTGPADLRADRLRPHTRNTHAARR